MEENNMESEAEISTNWLDTNSRTHIWEVIYNNEKETLLNNDTINQKANDIIRIRLLKVYELVVLFSSLSCAALVGISDSKNENQSIVIIHDTIRGYGIVTSSLGAIISLSTCMIMSALPQKHTMDFLHIFMRYSNIPVFTTVFSIFALMTCASFQFTNTVMYIVLPYSTISFFYGLNVYNNLRTEMINLIEEK